MDEDSSVDHHTAFDHKSQYLRAVVGLTSALSIVGSLLIILSYIGFRDLRTKAREILMHISFMDFGVGASNLLGVGVNFSQYYEGSCNMANVVHHNHHNRSNHTVGDLCNVHTLIGGLCKVQGGLAHGFTLGSVLWTICLSMYLYLLVSRKGTREAKVFVRFAYFFCYLMPVGLTLWMAFTGRIGYTPFESTGWCGNVFVFMTSSHHKHRDIYAATIGYNLWILLTFFLVPVLSISAHMYIRDEVSRTLDHECIMVALCDCFPQVNTAGTRLHSDRLLVVLQRLDYKFLLVPVAFILLRMWSFFGDIWFVYANGPRITPDPLAKTLMYLEVYAPCFVHRQSYPLLSYNVYIIPCCPQNI